MTLLTVYALFGDDIRMIATSKKDDPVFFVLTLIAMSSFLIEIILSCICKPGYIFSFYFYLDFVSTITMVMDVGWIWDPVMGGGGSSGASQAKKVAQLARASRSARLGSKASKLVRVVRLIRMMRIVKLYKASNAVAAKKAGEDEEDEYFEQIRIKREEEERRKAELEGKEEMEIPEETKIGKVLSEVTTQKVIIMVLVMMLSVPLFSFATYAVETKSFLLGLDLITIYDNDYNGTGFETSYNSYVNYHKDVRTPLIWLTARSKVFDTNEDLENLRDAEKELVAPTNENLGDYYVGVFDLRPDTRMEAVFGILQTIFVCIMLTLGSFMFSKDANELVIGPIESMMGKVKLIAKDPLKAAAEEEKDAAARFQALKDQAELNKTACCPEEPEEKTECQLLESTIVKTGSLLAIGLGEAGGKIIAQNMGDDNAEGNINPLLPGQKVFAAFGFCDIRNFTDTTEILQEEVMMFVNEVADIVHNLTHLYLGEPNKNIGDAFLIVWKFFEKDLIREGNEVKLNTANPTVNLVADMVAFSFILIIAEVNKSQKLAKYRAYEGLNARMPNYRVKLGYGIHAGWAIEGAIGSEYKIDATYVSPHVNLTMELEEATKIYGVPFVMSHYYYELLSPQVQEMMRPLDKVLIHGFEHVVTVYTFDLDYMALEVEKKKEKELTAERNILLRIKARDQRNMIEAGTMDNSYAVRDKFLKNRDIAKMRKTYTKVFLKNL